MRPIERLCDLGLVLPTVAAPIGAYVPALRINNQVFSSGQLPFRDGKLAWTGRVPQDLRLEDARDAARQAALNGLAAIAGTCGGLDGIERIIRVGVFVNSSPGFTEQPKVANGASDLLVEIFGDNGRHARCAVGVSELPLNAAVEVELMALVR